MTSLQIIIACRNSLTIISARNSLINILIFLQIEVLSEIGNSSTELNNLIKMFMTRIGSCQSWQFIDWKSFNQLINIKSLIIS